MDDMVTPNFKKRRIKLNPEDYRSLRDRVFKRDGYRCVMCGSSFGLHMHHVKYRSQQGSDCEENCVTLDYICHDKVHKEKDFREKFSIVFSRIIDGSVKATPPEVVPKCTICGIEIYKLSNGRCDRCRVYFQRTGRERPNDLPVKLSKSGVCSICSKESESLKNGKCQTCNYHHKRYGITTAGQIINRQGINRKNNHRYYGKYLSENPGWKGINSNNASKRRRAVRRIPLGPCSKCGAPGTDRHHADRDLDNINFDNIEILCRSCHMAVDGRAQRLAEAGRKKIGTKTLKQCVNCGELKNPLRKGLCHRCNEYQRRNNSDRPQDSGQSSVSKDDCDLIIITKGRGRVQEVAHKIGISREYAYAIRAGRIPKKLKCHK
jgi:5-methylcytosine-specific restriction endonuclease McrA